MSGRMIDITAIKQPMLTTTLSMGSINQLYVKSLVNGRNFVFLTLKPQVSFPFGVPFTSNITLEVPVLTARLYVLSRCVTVLCFFSTEHARIYYIGNGECTLYLLAKDGVMVSGLHDTDMPRSVGNGVFMAQSSRVDVAVSCPGSNSGSATYPIWLTDEDGDHITIAYIEVTGTDTAPATQLTSFVPIRPDYLENLMPGKYQGNWEYQKYEYCEGYGPNRICKEMNYYKDMEVSGIQLVLSQPSVYSVFLEKRSINICLIGT